MSPNQRPTPKAELRIRMTKRTDGNVVLQCNRADGSVTWQRHDKHAAFFACHDLTHFVVETTFGFRQGFYGLIADGWDIPDTEGKGERGKLPPEAILVEHVAGLLDRERIGGSPLFTASEFNSQVELFVESNNLEGERVFTDEQLRKVRQRMEMLHNEWSSIAPGCSLELIFERTGAQSDRIRNSGRF